MFVKRLAVVIGIMALSGVIGTDSVLAQKKHKPVFSSTYTDLSKGWKVDPRFASTAKEDAEMGRDTPQVHAGYGGYSFQEDYGAMAAYRTVVSASSPAYSLDLKTGKSGLEVYKDTVEWRTAGGKPFAIIARIEVHSQTAVETGRVTRATRTGTYLIVRGLRGYGHIQANVDATKPDANVRARKIADSGYLRGYQQ